MSNICFAWELGQNYGHLSRILPLASRLQAAGHSTHLVLRDLSRLHKLAGEELPRSFQAPIWLPKLLDMPLPQGYADILLAAGYGDASGLRSLVSAWLALLDVNHSALVVADHSPTALLAARIMGLPSVTMGSGFVSPPLSPLLPSSFWWQDEDPQQLRTTERHVLETVNKVLDAFNAKPLSRLSDLFDVDEVFLRTFAELDHYPLRASQQTRTPDYLGPTMLLNHGETPKWPNAGGAKIFAYLNASWPGLSDMLDTLQSLPICVLAHIPSLTTEQEEAYSKGNVRVTSELQQIEAVRQQCDFAVCHGGAATVSAMLTAGRPLLLAPTHPEQVITCRNVETMKAGLALRDDKRRYPTKKLLEYLISEPGFIREAQAFARRYKDYSQHAANDHIVERCEALLCRAQSPHERAERAS